MSSSVLLVAGFSTCGCPGSAPPYAAVAGEGSRAVSSLTKYGDFAITTAKPPQSNQERAPRVPRRDMTRHPPLLLAALCAVVVASASAAPPPVRVVSMAR